MQKVTLILSYHDKAVQYEWLIDSIDKSKIELSFILLNDKETYIENFIAARGLNFVRINYSGKKNIPKAILKTISFLRKNKTDVVHTHLFDANIVGLTAAKLAGIKKRIYTRHHASYHHKYFPKAVKYDRYCNRLATDIVAITKMVKNILVEKENVPEKKIKLIPHGFMLDEFKNAKPENVELLKKKYNLVGKHPVVGVVSRYIHLKGIQFIIPAFKKLLNDFPEAVLVLANAQGTYKTEIQNLLKENFTEKNYREILFENDSFALYKCFDAFVHVPLYEDSEAFGQTYVEALAAGIPSVFSMSGIAPDFIEHEKNALIVAHRNADEIYFALKRILSDKALCEKLIANGQQSVFNLFTFDKFLNLTTQLYLAD